MDDFIVSFIIGSCENIGQMFLADFIGIDRFWMGVYILTVLGGALIGAAIPMILKEKKHVH